MKVWLSPTGNTIKGHVLDCAVGPLVERLRDYDPQLYVTWNPRKLRGWGLWEVRRRPDTKSIVETTQCDGFGIHRMEYKELNMINHVLDVPFLNYLILEKLKKMDMWNQKETGYKGKDLVKTLDYNEAKHDEKIDEESSRELEYNLKQYKSEIGWFKDYVASGQNPYRIADYWGK